MACVLEAPLRMSVLSEVTASSRHYVDRLFDLDPQKVLQGVIDMKNAVIGNNKQKANLIVLGAVPRLLYLLQQETSSTELRTECAVVLGSLAMGTENNVKSLLDCHIIPALLQGLLSPDLKFIEACLRCLRTIFISPVTPEDLLYTDATVISHLMALLSRSRYTQEYICQIFSHCCKVRMQALKCFSVLAFENPQVSMTLVNVSVDGELLPQIFVKMLQRDKPIEMQLTSAKCLTSMCRAGAIRTDDSCIVLKTLPCLVRMCSKERLLEERVEGAETLAYLIETDVELQRIASITDHLIVMLADYFKYPSSVSAITDIKRLDHDLKHAHELRQAAFKLYASLGANDEDIRKKIIETENMMDRIVNGLSESSIKVRLAAVRCLHSLSRSVQQLRTSFQDHAVWKPLMKVLQNAPNEILVVASSTLCNLLLEFSPSKEPILESGAIELLCSLTQSENLALRVNGIWALMNMAFQAEQKIKSDILRGLSTEQLFQLLSDSDVNVLMKTLGLLRNLLSTRPHIDHIMSTHGKQIMQAVTLILEGEHNIEVKEQTLCILANIADGTTAKELIMTNDDILQKIKYYMSHSNAKLQLAAMFCISNLIWNEEEGSQERQDKLRDMGIVDILHKLSQSSDPNLCDKAKTALQQYLA
ncbi:armadillo repeat-containing protein 8 isoform X6 [Pezoporus wallicus]|uniref:armadillo repeat-containing protein 8 isoform X6 n=1 Tax=Strigops habroptila TaxID=2489341 RepID=UPI0011CEE7A6|nr:armadillo repeat-containing protein 8 isoform X6 [Strigops habroptila]XP_057285311.1 armadillo repeat-containing protein 8 isoform X6 [Pezoporus wallicus]XP_061321243.1 armadillo repeat-containing protein 8 isoform X6 [Pezoporus flaviventris]